MIVDDSTVARAVLSRMIESDPAFRDHRRRRNRRGRDRGAWRMPRRCRPSRPRNARRRRAQIDPADHRRGRRRQGDDRLLAGRGRRRADRCRACAGRRRHAAQARHRPLQRQIFRNPARQAQGAWLRAEPSSPAARGRSAGGTRHASGDAFGPDRRCLRSALRPAASMRSARFSTRCPSGSACRSSSRSICRSRS